MTTSAVAIELRVISMPLAEEFRTSRSRDTVRELMVVRWVGPDSEGWAECASGPRPRYFAEFLTGAIAILESELVPLVASEGTITASRARELMLQVPGNQNAKAAIETAILDAELRAYGVPLSEYLGGTADRVPVGVSVGIADRVADLLDRVERYVQEGYRRIKLKIQPGWDIEPVAEVRRVFGTDLMLQVDANQAYSSADACILRRLDEYGLLLFEQPFARDDLMGHARLAEQLSTPLCLDESITSLQSAAVAISLGACGAVNIKPGRVGGYLEARSIHDLCMAHGIPVFCGGVLETGIGRAANLALASLPNFSLPGDISATSRYYDRDITQAFELRDGHMDVPCGAGTGAHVDMATLADVTVHTRTVRPSVEPFPPYVRTGGASIPAAAADAASTLS